MAYRVEWLPTKKHGGASLPRTSPLSSADRFGDCRPPSGISTGCSVPPTLYRGIHWRVGDAGPQPKFAFHFIKIFMREARIDRWHVGLCPCQPPRCRLIPNLAPKPPPLNLSPLAARFMAQNAAVCKRAGN
jgi:hypothetical protein